MIVRGIRFSKSLKIFIRNYAGAAAIEFALVAPVFLLILFAIIAYGIYFTAASAVQQLSADAARASIAGLNEKERLWLAESFVRLNTSNYTLLNSAHVTVHLAASASDPNQFNVAVSYDASTLPIWNLYVPLPLPEKDITRAVTIRHGGV